jgi:hypothetical protein
MKLSEARDLINKLATIDTYFSHNIKNRDEFDRIFNNLIKSTNNFMDIIKKAENKDRDYIFVTSLTVNMLKARQYLAQYSKCFSPSDISLTDHEMYSKIKWKDVFK